MANNVASNQGLNMFAFNKHHLEKTTDKYKYEARYQQTCRKCDG